MARRGDRGGRRRSGRLDRRARNEGGTATTRTPPHRTVERSQRMRWATRPHCHVDRAACAWFIERFIDREAEFVFVAELIDVPDDATPFDMRGAELSHREGDCSFERLLHVHGIEDEVLWRIARIVHEADIGDDRYEAPESP